MRHCIRLMIVALTFPVSGASAQKCSDAQAKQAEAEASSLQSWDQVYRSFRRFAACDDGAISEGYSSTVARLLSDNWDTTGFLQRRTSNNKSFEKFVLRHVDQLMSEDQEQKIRENASSHCPPGAAKLCSSIITRIQQTAP